MQDTSLTSMSLKEYYRQYAIKHRDKISAYQKAWAVKNQDRLKERRKEYYLFNKEKINARRNAKFHRDKADKPEYFMWIGARDRAKRKGQDFNIELLDIVFPEFCPVLGLRLQVNKGGLKEDSPVLDRIKNDQGYVKGNVQAISAQANRLKGNATFEQLILLGEWAKRYVS